MFELHISSDTLAGLQQAMALAPDDVEAEVHGATYRATPVIEREVKNRTPTNKVTTGGRLRNAITWRVEDFGRWWRGVVEVNSVPYAPWVEKDTRPHDIYPKNGKALVFGPLAGFKLAYRNTATGRVVGARTARGMAASGKAGLLRVERGRALFGMSGKPGKTTTNQAKASQVIVQHVHHPGTKGFHMFEEGAKAAWPQVERIFSAALRRVTARLAR